MRQNPGPATGAPAGISDEAARSQAIMVRGISGRASDRTVRAWLARCREQEDACDPWLLAGIAEALAASGDPGKPARTGVTEDWLREQGELAARAGIHGGPGGKSDGKPVPPETLFRLRRAYDALGVSRAGWAVRDSDLDDALMRAAREEFGQALRHESPAGAWRVMRMQAAGCIRDLDDVAPGARDVITGYVIRHFRAVLAGNSETTAWTRLLDLRDALPGLDKDTVAALRDAGIPADRDSLEHAARVCQLRWHWERRDDDDSFVLAAVCEDILDGTIEASEIGVTTEEIWETARAWMARHARRAAAGDYEDLHCLTAFADRTGPGCDPCGLIRSQVAAWEEARARDCWTRAVAAGDGQAAFEAICRITDQGGRWEQVTGQDEQRARPRLQSVMNDYAAGLRRQVETARTPELARQPYRELAEFTDLVRKTNEHARKMAGAPLADMPRATTPAELDQLYDRHVSPDGTSPGDRNRAQEHAAAGREESEGLTAMDVTVRCSRGEHTGTNDSTVPGGPAGITRPEDERVGEPR